MVKSGARYALAIPESQFSIPDSTYVESRPPGKNLRQHIRRVIERVVVKAVFGQAGIDKQFATGIDHCRRSAHIDVVAGEIRPVFQYRLMHQTFAHAREAGLFRIGQHGMKAQVLRRRRPLFGQRMQIKICLVARAPIHVDRTTRTQRKEMLKDGFHWRKTGTASHEDHRPFGIFARHEGTKRAFDAQGVAFFQHIADPRGETTPGNVANVQFDCTIRLRSVGNGKRSATTIVQQHIKVLPGQPVQTQFARCGLQMQTDYVRRKLPFAAHLHGELATCHILHRGDFARFQHQIAGRHGLAQQHRVMHSILHVQGRRRVAWILAAAFDQHRLATAAHTGTARVRQGDASPLRGFQHGFAGHDVETAAGSLENDSKHGAHCRRWGGRRTMRAPRTSINNMRIWKQDTDLARLNGWSKNTLMEVLGIRITAVGDDWLQGTMPVDQRTHQPYGILHGGASVALAETLGSTAAMLTLDAEKERAVGLDINANHVRGVQQGMVTGTARPLHTGRSTQVWEIRIEDEAGKLVCISRLTMAVVPATAVGSR
jgi:1,4-dihydroxy-2-naphthoyl-CoA hydrolase